MPASIESGIRQQPLLPNPARLAMAQSVDEAIGLVRANLSEHKLKIAERRPRPVAMLSGLNLADCAIVSLQYGFDVDIDAGCIEDFFMLKMTVTGNGRITSNRQIAVTSPAAIFITNPQAHTYFRMSASCRHLTTRICRRAIEERLMQKLGRRLQQPLEFQFEIGAQTEFGLAWQQLVTHICEVSATAPSVLASEDVRAQYSRTVIELLLHSAPHNYSQSLRQADAPLSPRHVRRAQEYVEAHLPEIRSVADIAAAIGVSARTLQNGFKESLNLSPAEYIRQVRIQALHQALLQADNSASVTSLMAAVGIVSFGRYAEYYRQQIGVAPSITLRKAP